MLTHLTRREIHRLYLHAGAMGAAADLCVLLQEHNADVCWSTAVVPDGGSTSPLLHFSCTVGDTQVAHVLLEAVARRQALVFSAPPLSPSSRAPLPHHSSKLSPLELASGRGLSGRDRRPHIFPFSTAHRGPNTSVLQLVAMQDSRGWSALHCAAFSGLPDTLRLLLRSLVEHCGALAARRLAVSAGQGPLPSPLGIARGGALALLLAWLPGSDAALDPPPPPPLAPSRPSHASSLQVLLETPIPQAGFAALRDFHCSGSALTPAPPSPPLPYAPTRPCLRWRQVLSTAGEEWGILNPQHQELAASGGIGEQGCAIVSPYSGSAADSVDGAEQGGTASFAFVLHPYHCAALQSSPGEAHLLPASFTTTPTYSEGAGDGASCGAAARAMVGQMTASQPHALPAALAHPAPLPSPIQGAQALSTSPSIAGRRSLLEKFRLSSLTASTHASSPTLSTPRFSSSPPPPGKGGAAALF